MARSLAQLQKQYASAAAPSKGPMGGPGRGPGARAHGKPKNARATVSRLLSYIRPYRFRLVLVLLWVLASLENTAYISVVVCFAAFFANDLYGFVNWRRIAASQAQSRK